MMRFQITHVTSYAYSEPVSETGMELRLQPADGSTQRCQRFDLEVVPAVQVRSYLDGFGNRVHHFNLVPPHQRLRIISRSVVETGLEGGHPAGGDLWDDLLLFRPPVVDVAAVRRLAARHRPPERADPDALEAALDGLTTDIHKRFEYSREVTNVYTRVDEVLKLKRGVCQDFAHLLVAVCRAMGVPARYVSGYVYAGNGDLLVGASHAWAEAWVRGRGWLGFDATHPVRAGARHVRVAVGRDYRDAAPTRGVYMGSARGVMEVRVEIRPGPGALEAKG